MLDVFFQGQGLKQSHNKDGTGPSKALPSRRSPQAEKRRRSPQGERRRRVSPHKEQYSHQGVQTSQQGERRRRVSPHKEQLSDQGVQTSDSARVSISPPIGEHTPINNCRK